MIALSIDETHRRVVEAVLSLEGAEEVPLREARGRVSCRDVRAAGDQPRFDSSAMDGWAVNGSGDGGYRIVGESRAGRAFGRVLGEGEAIHISTGAKIPAGAAAIVRRENGRVAAGVLIAQGVAPGRDMRLRGCDFRRGDPLLHAGRRLDHFDIARLAASGLDRLHVNSVPRVALLATGNEIVRPGRTAPAEGNYDALSFALWARLTQLGVTVTDLGSAEDSDAAIRERAVSAGADILIVIGGASGGRHDRARAAFAPHGLEVMVPAVRMKPGKPFWFGRYDGRRLVAGLPGNPVAALAALELFIVPALLAVQGRPAAFRWEPCAAPAQGVPGGAERVRFARRGATGTEVIDCDDSAALSPLAGADALCRIGPDGARSADLLMHETGPAPSCQAARVENEMKTFPLHDRVNETFLPVAARYGAGTINHQAGSVYEMLFIK